MIGQVYGFSIGEHAGIKGRIYGEGFTRSPQ